MANTQTTVPLFVANAVLTAAQQNASAGTGVPVFATTVTRDAAFGGSNKALAEGQLCYIEASNIVQYYDGAAWATVGPTTSGVTLLSATALSGTTSINDCFSATYQNYNIRVNAIMPAGTVLRIRYRVSAADNTTSNYDSGSTTNYTNSSTAGFQSQSVAATSFNLALPTSCTGWNGSLDVFNPFATDYSTMTGSNAFAQTGAFSFYMMSGFTFRLTTSFTGLTFFTDSGNLTGTVKVYGLANS